MPREQGERSKTKVVHDINEALNIGRREARPYLQKLTCEELERLLLSVQKMRTAAREELRLDPIGEEYGN